LFHYIISPLTIRAKFCFQDVGEKKYPEKHKKDKQFNENDDPEPLAHSHRPESFQIKKIYTFD
jgi:hypothetical protein